MKCASVCCLPRPIMIVDVETTSEKPRTGRVIEVSLRLLTPELRDEGEYSTLLRVEGDLGPANIHGIRPHMVRHAPQFGQVAATVTAAAQGRIIVGHSVGKDMEFLNAELIRAGWAPLHNLALCTWQSVKRMPGAPERTGLLDVALSLGVGASGAHRAAVDTRLTADVLRQLVRSSHDNHWHLADLSGSAPSPSASPLPANCLRLDQLRGVRRAG